MSPNVENSAITLPVGMHAPSGLPFETIAGRHRSLRRSLKIALLACVSILLLLQTQSRSQQISQITLVKLVYWRAFHDEIEIRMGVTFKGDRYLNTNIRSSNGIVKSTSRKIGEDEFSVVVKTVNDAAFRDYFLHCKDEVEPDGSVVELEVSENSYTIAFRARSPFSGKPSEQIEKLQALMLTIFKWAKVEIPVKERY